MNVDEFKRYLVIDKNNLDDEVTHQSELFFRVAEAYAAAAAERDTLKEMLATIDAQLDAIIREELEGDKFTEAMVKNRIQVHPNHKAAFDSFLEAKQKADVLGALKDAFHTRSYLLRDLCQLALANFFETSAVKDTPITDNAVYRRQRQRLAEARERQE
jgi:hypothetical protein